MLEAGQVRVLLADAGTYLQGKPQAWDVVFLDPPFREGMELLEQGEIDQASELFHEVFRAIPQLANACLKKALDWLKSDEHERLKALERENRELRRANEILRKASAYFAQAELDRRPKR